MASSNSGNGAPVIVKVENEIEGERFETTDYFFEKIGEAVPLKPNWDFENESLPSQPLALSEHLGLIFVAHSSGFFVARTEDVINSAEEIKEKGGGSSIQQVSLVNVPAGRVHILALSTDNSTLAASVSGDLLFYQVHSLLNKDLKHSFSCSLNESSTLKDMKWKTNAEHSYIVLSHSGKLYRGKVGGHLEYVMDNVDAVEWSVKGEFIAMARKNVLSVWSSHFNQRIGISLPLKTLDCNSDEECEIKVDSIKWVRRDCIILGCFQLTDDGKEENYLLQVVRSRDGQIIDGSSELFVHSFNDVYPGVVDDIVPFGSGPHLFFTYLEGCQLAITANRKNTDQHIVLLGWSLVDDENEAVVIDIERDNFLPRIELQENGDDNLILGLCVDKVSTYGKVNVQLGVDEMANLSPYCVIMCLTLAGKLIMFHFASLTGSEVPHGVMSAPPDVEDKASGEVSVESQSTILPAIRNESLGPQQQILNEKVNIQDVENSKKDNLHGSEMKRSFISNTTSDHLQCQREELTWCQEREQEQNVQAVHANPQKIVPSAKLKQEPSDKKELSFEKGNSSSGQLSSDATHLMQPDLIFKDISMGTQKTAGLGSSPGSFMVKSSLAASNTNSSNLKTSIMMSKGLLDKIKFSGSQSAFSQIVSGEKTSFMNSFDKISSFTHVSAQSTSWGNLVLSAGAPNNQGPEVSVIPPVKPFQGIPSKPVQRGEQRTLLGTGNIESIPLVRSSLKSSQENMITGKSSHKCYPTREHNRAPYVSAMLGHDSNLPKQLGNINEMTRELDTLLESIEELGGLRESCTIELQSSIEVLERGLVTLFEKCKLLRGLLDYHLEEIEYVLDKTIQVSARKVYMQGIVKQATDGKYWDLWARQKLSSELELKRYNILKMNQDITSQLIQLERHFNFTELNNFVKSSVTCVGHRSLKNRYGPSRSFQSLHSLHNTMSSQLIAAESLSECLSKQMEALSVNSSSQGQKNFKKELFEMIGMPYDASFSSPDVRKVDATNSNKKNSLSAASILKDQSRRSQLSIVKNSEPETARRRRDSLDQSWTSHMPPKTTVKRMLLQEDKKGTASRPFFLVDKQNVDPVVLEGSAFACPRDHKIPSTVLSLSEDQEVKGILDSTPKKVSENSIQFTWADNLPRTTQSTVLKPTNVPAVSRLPASKLPASLVHTSETHQRTMGISQADIDKADLFPMNKAKPTLLSESAMSQRFSLNTDKHSISNKCSEMSNDAGTNVFSSTIASESGFGFVGASSRIGGFSGSASTGSRFVDLTSGGGRFTGVSSSVGIGTFSNQGSGLTPFSIQSSVSTATDLTGKVIQLSTEVDKGQLGGKLSHQTYSKPPEPPMSPNSKSASVPSVSSSVSCLTIPFSSTSAELGGSLINSNDNVAANKTASPSSTFPALAVSSSVSLSYHSPKPTASSFTILSLPSSTIEPDALPIVTSDAKSGQNAAEGKEASESDSLPAELKLKLDPSPKSGSTSEITDGQSSYITTNSAPVEAFNPAGQSSKYIASSLSTKPLNSRLEQPTSALQFSTPFPTSAGDTAENNESLDVGVTGDDMEEEAPEEGNNATELNLGSLGGFGIGSTSISSVPKPNPFGSSFSDAAIDIPKSTFTLTAPCAQLFRPASFAFHSPPSQTTASGSFSGNFSIGMAFQAPNQSMFGQPAQLSSGQQALGSVLGSFGQSRQLGAALPGSNFAGGSSPGGFSSVATVGGFAGIASTGGGFAGAASGGGGFAGAASAGGFGAFSNHQGSGFAVGRSRDTSKPTDLFTQMRK